MKLQKVSRLTGPQIAEGLDKLPSKDLKALRAQLAKPVPEAKREAFVDDVVARLAKDGQVPGTAPAEALKRAVSLELAKLERAAAKSGLRRAGETITLAAVEKNFGKTVAALLESLENIDIEGRLDHEGRVPLTESTALQTKAVYDKLGLDADDAAVVHEMAKIYETFSDVTLDSLHRKFARILPDRRALKSDKALAALTKEAELVASVMERQSIKSVPRLVQVMQGLGYESFDVGRLGYLRSRVPGVVPSLSRARTPDDFRKIGERIRAFIDKHPAADAAVLAQALKVPKAVVAEAAELAGIALTTARTASVLDPYDPVCDGLVRHALLSRAKGQSLAAAMKTLHENPEFVKRFKDVTLTQLTEYVDEHLPQLKKAAGGAPWTGAAPGVRDRRYAELAAFFYATPDIDESGVFAMLKAFDPGFNKYALTKLRKEHPDLSLGLRTVDKDERERMAKVIGRLARAMPGASFKEIAEVAWQQGLPRLTDTRIIDLRNEFPRLIDKRIDRSDDERLAEIESGVAAFLTAHPHASVAEVAKAVGARETQVVKPMRRFRAQELTSGQTRFNEVDRAIVERVIRSAEPGDTLGDIRARLLQDPTFGKRHAGVSEQIVRDVSTALVPEAADWKVYNLTIVARILDEALEKNAGAKSLSKVVDDLRAVHPGFPSYVMLCGTTARSLEKHIDKVPCLTKYLVDGRLKFSSRGPEAKLTEELALLVADAFAKAPSDWKNDRIFAKIHEDAKVRAQYPVLNESTLNGLRMKFPGVIKPRTQPSSPAAASVAGGGEERAGDAKKLAAQLQRIVDKGGKITLDVVAKEWGVDPQYFRRLINRHPQLFPMYKKRYEITEHIARTMGLVIATMPMGTTLDEAAVLLEKSGLFPPDMKMQKTLLLNAERKFPALVPNLKTRNEELFLRLVCRDIATRPKGTSLAQIFDDAKAQTGQLLVSLDRFQNEIAPSWAKTPAKERPSWVAAVMPQGKVASSALGQKSFPKEDLAAVERDLAQLAQVPDRLEMLERIIARKARNTFADCNVLCIQHLLGSNFRFVEAVHRLGAKKDDILTVGIPYSTSDTVARTMNDGGLETYTPPLNIAAWERQVEDALYALVEKSKKNHKKIVVFDDGGLVAKILHEKPWFAEHKDKFRIVEQTTRGITVAKQYDLDVPLVNYAQDPAKNLEGVMIGDVVVEHIYKRLDALGHKNVKGMPVTCVGAGVIGLPTALDMARAGAKVRIYDTDPAARAAAKKAAQAEGLDIEVLDDPKAAFTGAKMIIGCTGHTSIGKEAFQHMADGCILVSTSSKLVEIDMGLLDSSASSGPGGLRRTVVDDKDHPPTCEYILDDGRKITVLADGFPVNFDGAVNCVEPNDIQLTHAGMLLAGIQATWKDLDDGLLPFDDKLRAELLRDWDEVKAELSARAPVAPT